MDFIEKQDGAPAFQKVLSGLRDDLRQIFLFADDSGKVEEFRVDRFGYEVREARFPGSRRSPENHGDEPSGLEDFPYGRTFSNEVFLTDEFVEIPRSENRRQRFYSLLHGRVGKKSRQVYRNAWDTPLSGCLNR